MSTISTIDPAATLPSNASESGVALPLRFTGSGSEYFRIWIVNLLLMLVTLGIYYPWARARMLRYFHANTLVGGHGLGFHGSPRRMLRGTALIAALAAVYGLAERVAPGAQLVALLIVALVWPALLRAGQQFRLANTSWRGLRMRFTGDLPGAYRAVMPLYVPGALWALGAAYASFGSAPSNNALGVILALVMLATVAALPWLLWSLKKYQHDHYALGPFETRLEVGVGAFYRLTARAIGLAILIGGAAVLVALGLIGSLGQLGGSGRGGWQAVLSVLVLVMGYLSIGLCVQPYFAARLQNLVWSNTRGTLLRFDSQLKARRLVGLGVRNWLFILLTLGLYWPFAKVAVARLRLEAVTVVVRQSPDQIFAGALGPAGDAAGDAAGELFGIDIGL